MIQSISKKDGKVIAQAIEELLNDATVKASGYPSPYQHSFWKGYVESGLQQIATHAERGVVVLNDKK